MLESSSTFYNLGSFLPSEAFIIINAHALISYTFSGSLVDGSPAALCGQLHVGDRVVAVNGIDIINLPHNDIVALIKKSGLSVRLTISPSLSSGDHHLGIH